MKARIFYPLVAIVGIMISVLIIAAICIKMGFFSNLGNHSTIGDLPTPKGYTRVECPQGSMGEYLRGLPLKPRGTPVHLYTGGVARFQSMNYAVVDLPLFSNAEQCADVCMRLRAEYLYHQGKYSQIRFTTVQGNQLQYASGNDRLAFKAFMRTVYETCNTASMCQSLRLREREDLQPGDVFVYKARAGRQYGHAVMVVDMAVNKKGEKIFLAVQGNTPARNMHVMRNGSSLRYTPWFKLNTDGDVQYISPFVFYEKEQRHW